MNGYLVILVLGIAKVGKTLISQEVAERYKGKVLHTDYYRREWGFHLPHQGYSTEIHPSRQQLFYQRLRQEIDRYTRDYPVVIVEGNAIHPKDVAYFNAQGVLLLGNRLTVDQKLKRAKQYSDAREWVNRREDDYLENLFEFYQQVEQRWCTQYPEYFIDMTEFEQGREKAFDYITQIIKQHQQGGHTMARNGGNTGVRVTREQAKELMRQLSTKLSNDDYIGMSEQRLVVRKRGNQVIYKWQDLPTPDIVYVFNSINAQQFYLPFKDHYKHMGIGKGHELLYQLALQEINNQGRAAAKQRPQTQSAAPTKPQGQLTQVEPPKRHRQVIEDAQQYVSGVPAENMSIGALANELRQYLMSEYGVASSQMGGTIKLLFQDEPLTINVKDLI